MAVMPSSDERSMTLKAALHFYHMEAGSSPEYWSYEYPQLMTLRNELLAAGIPEREVDGNGAIQAPEDDDEEEEEDGVD
jgi:hypothetical protein